MSAPAGAGRAERRLRARAQRKAINAALELLYGGGSYTGASSEKRSLKNWGPLARSADVDTIADLPTLRARSRDLERNAAIGRGAINTVVTSTVGTGIRLSAQVDHKFLGLDREEAAAWEDAAERIWQAWCDECDVTRAQCFDQVLDLALRSQLVSGDLFVVRRFDARPGDLLGLKLQLLEADRVGTPKDRQDKGIVDGVELDPNGVPLGYWFRNRHPDDGLGRGAEVFERLAAFGAKSQRRQVLHLFDRSRPGQTRGVPYLAPVIETLKQIDRYSESELLAAVVSSFFTVFVTSQDGTGLANETGDPTATDTGKIDSPTRDLELGPAAVLDLMPGENVTIADPKRPNAAFDPFVQAMITQVGVALEMPFEVLTKHFTASYSASRAALLEAWRFFRKRRVWLVKGLCEPVYEWVITEAVLRGLLQAPGFLESPLMRRAYLGATWTGPAQGQIDPKKEIDAATQRIDLGVSTFSEVTSEFTGGDWFEKHERLREEHALLAAAGFARFASKGAAPQGDQGEEPEPNPDAPEGEDES